MDPTPMMTFAELADHLGKSRQCLYQWRARGVFPFRIHGGGRKLRVNREEVEAYVRTHGAVPGVPSNGPDTPPTAPIARNSRELSRSTGSSLEIPLAPDVSFREAGELVRRLQQGAHLSVILAEHGCCLCVTGP